MPARSARRFDVVLLASHLVTAPVDGPAFLATAAAHLEPGGFVIVETYPPGWDPTERVGRPGRLGDATIELLRASVDGDLLEALVRYGVDGRVWEQAFQARLLDEPALARMLADAGFGAPRWLDRDGWFMATRAPDPDRDMADRA